MIVSRGEAEAGAGFYPTARGHSSGEKVTHPDSPGDRGRGGLIQDAIARRELD